MCFPIHLWPATKLTGQVSGIWQTGQVYEYWADQACVLCKVPTQAHASAAWLLVHQCSQCPHAWQKKRVYAPAGTSMLPAQIDAASYCPGGRHAWT